jgi:WhiB family transcriptional regulator, redox-sensing transcriptional regulator
MSDWRRDAACQGMDPELWFPVSNHPKDPAEFQRISRAKTVCRSCPVRAECLAYAQDTGQRGIWGGMDEDERRSRQRRSRRRRQPVAV